MANRIERVQHTLELDEGLNLHITGWVVQRIGWVLFLLILVAGSLGVFGTGILSKRTVQAAGSKIAYERFGRYESSSEIRLLATVLNGHAEVRIPQHYSQQFQVRQITPEPEQQRAENGYYVYTYQADGPINILLRGMPQETGSIQATLFINDTRFSISQYIYP